MSTHSGMVLLFSNVLRRDSCMGHSALDHFIRKLKDPLSSRLPQRGGTADHQDALFGEALDFLLGHFAETFINLTHSLQNLQCQID